MRQVSIRLCICFPHYFIIVDCLVKEEGVCFNGVTMVQESSNFKAEHRIINTETTATKNKKVVDPFDHLFFFCHYSSVFL